MGSERTGLPHIVADASYQLYRQKHFLFGQASMRVLRRFRCGPKTESTPLAASITASRAIRSGCPCHVRRAARRTTGVSPHTQRIWRQTKQKLVENFGANRPTDEITRGDATDWRLTFIAAGLADATVRKHCGFAKHFFAQALDHEIISANPFSKLVSSPVGNQQLPTKYHRDKTRLVEFWQ